MEKNFTHYINHLRIGFSLTQMKNNPNFRKYTIKAIAEEVGFKTAESFNRAFYEKAGIYPSYYLKQIEKEA